MRTNQKLFPYQAGRLTITPQMADDILTCFPYPDQRKIRDDRVLALAEQLEKGQWETSAIKVALCRENETSYLIDGQHRLHAIKLAEKPAELVVILDTKATRADVDAAYRRTDIGAVRTLQDRLRTAHLPEDTDLTEVEARYVGNAVAVIADGFASNNPFQRRNNIVVRDDETRFCLIQEWAPEARVYFDCQKGIPGHDRNKLRNAIYVAIGLVTFRYQPVKALEFWTGVANNADLPKFSAMWTIRNRVMVEEAKRYPMTIFERRVAACWNAHYSGTKLEKVIVKNPDANIQISGSPYTYAREIRYEEPQNP